MQRQKAHEDWSISRLSLEDQLKSYDVVIFGLNRLDTASRRGFAKRGLCRHGEATLRRSWFWVMHRYGVDSFTVFCISRGQSA